MHHPPALLIVDDEKDALASLRRALSKEPYDIFTATSGPEALTLMETTPVSLVLCDYRMPGMDGLSLLAAIKGKKPEVGVIMSTGFASTEVAIGALRRGADDFLTKPWKPADLKSRLKLCLERMDLKRKVRESEKALQASERKFRSILAAMPDAVYICSPDFRIEYMNPVMVATVGRDATGEPCHEAIRRRDAKCPDCRFDRIKQGEPVVTEWTGPENGAVYSVIETPVANPDGTVSKLSVFRDITGLAEHRQSLEERVAARTRDLRAANAGLARANRLKDEFLANMSHELRTPLTAVLGMSEALLEQSYGSLNDQQVKSLQTVEASGRHLLNLINDILDLARIGAGKMELQTGRVSVEAVCRAALGMVRQMAVRKGHTLSLGMDTGPEFIAADMLRLKQILVNLLTNAVKFTPAGGEIGLAANLSADGRTVEFTVRDTGPGIPAENLKTVFDPFVQLDSSHTRQHEGAGLGLALVYKLAELHGGSVKIDSEPGKFTRVTVALPTTAGGTGSAADNEKSTPAAGRTGLAGDLTGVKVLVVDDNRAGNKTICRYLTSKSMHVLEAYDGRQAVELVFGEKPDLVLMDIQMPKMDGLEAIRRIREAERQSNPEIRKTPIIALTALAMPGDREKCLAAGADDYMSKPVRLKALLDLIGKYGKPGVAPS